MLESARDKATFGLMMAITALLFSALAWLCLRQPIQDAHSEGTQRMSPQGQHQTELSA